MGCLRNTLAIIIAIGAGIFCLAMVSIATIMDHENARIRLETEENNRQQETIAKLDLTYKQVAVIGKLLSEKGATLRELNDVGLIKIDYGALLEATSVWYRTQGIDLQAEKDFKLPIRALADKQNDAFWQTIIKLPPLPPGVETFPDTSAIPIAN